MKKNFTLPIKIHYKKTMSTMMLIGFAVAMWLLAPLFLKKWILTYGEWIATVYWLLFIVIIVQIVRLKINVMKQDPNIIIKQDRLHLLYKNKYYKIPFVKIKDIQLKHTYGRYTEYYLALTVIDDKNPNKDLKINYSLDFGLMVIQGQSIDAFITFDMIWQALHNYRHQSNEAIRIRKKKRVGMAGKIDDYKYST